MRRYSKMEEKTDKTIQNNLKKLSLVELEEQYERQAGVLRNKEIVGKLPDKGAQLKVKAEKLEKEITSRKAISDLEESMSKLVVNQSEDLSQEKHIRYVCDMEKSPPKARYKPGSTLNTSKFKDHPTKLILLPESMLLQAEQANRLPESHIGPSDIGIKMEGKVKYEEVEHEKESHWDEVD